MEGFNWKQFLGDLVSSLGVKILFAAVVLVVGCWIASHLPKIIGKGKGFSKLDCTLQKFIQSFVKIASYSIVFISVALILGVPATSFMAILTSAGVAIGLALQGSLANFAGGIMLLIFKPFAVGDYIEGAAVFGTVESITIFYTLLTTPDNKRITVPNGSLSNSTVINYSANNSRRNDLEFEVAYDSDIDTVRAVLLECAADCEYTLKDPAPVVLLSKHAESSLVFILRVWTENSKYWDANFSLIEEVKRRFDANGIEIPYKQMDIHIDKA